MPMANRRLLQSHQKAAFPGGGTPKQLQTSLLQPFNFWSSLNGRWELGADDKRGLILKDGRMISQLLRPDDILRKVNKMDFRRAGKIIKHPTQSKSFQKQACFREVLRKEKGLTTSPAMTMSVMNSIWS